MSASPVSAPRVGVQIANSGSAALDPGVAAMAVMAERAGADAVWVSDHLLTVDPGGERSAGVAASGGYDPWLESLTCLAAAAAVTSRVTVGTNVLVLPQRNVLQLAKTAVTVDRLSGGRMRLGLGVGWNEAEFEALGQDFGTRGRRADEMLEVLRAAWTGRPPAYAGRQLTVSPGVVLEPRPVHPAGIPLLIGGNSPRARRRVLEHGDGWLGLGRVGQFSLGAVAEILRDLRRHRSPRPGFAPQDAFTLWAPPGETRRLPELARGLAEAGFDEIILHGIWDQSPAAVADLIAEVREAVGAGEAAPIPKA